MVRPETFGPYYVALDTGMTSAHLLLLLLLLLLLFVMAFMQGIYIHTAETNCVLWRTCCSYSVVTIYSTYNVTAHFLFCCCWNKQCKMLFPVFNVFYFTLVLSEVCMQYSVFAFFFFCSSLTWCFPGMLLGYFNYFEMLPVAFII